MCDKCSTGRHKGHPVKEVSQQVTQNKKQILQAIQTLPEKKRQLEQVIQTIDETERKLEDCKNKTYDHTEVKFMKLRQLIDLREKELLVNSRQMATSKETQFSIQQEGLELRQLINRQEKPFLIKCRKMAITKETSLSIQKKGLQRLSESMNHCHSLASIATSQYTDVQLLSISQTLQDRADTLQQQFTDTSLDLCETPDVSVEFNTDALVKMITEFGGVADQSPSRSNTTAVVPRQRLGIGAEMKVKVTTRDSSDKELNKGGSVVRGILTCSGQGRVECPVSDNGDGTYLVSVIPQQLGQHQLSITVNSQDIQGSPFELSVVAQRDYTKLKDPVQTITDTNYPGYIAFTDSGDMFVTSETDCCIYVYDSSGKKKTTIGSRGNSEVQFQSPYGIDISGEVVYVADYYGDRIYKLTTEGEYIGVFGMVGSGIGEFNHPSNVKISPDGKVYVADCDNHRIQVFQPDWTISHVIDGKVPGDGSFSSPDGIAFDLSGNVHVGGFYSSSVTVFTPSGQIVHQYDKTHINRPTGIAIDPSGYSLVNNYNNDTLCIFDPSGKFINSVGGFLCQFGVSVSPDGSVWVADRNNNRLVKY